MSSFLNVILYIIFSMKNVIEIFAERLSELRKESNLSLMQLGKDLGVSDTALSRWERGVQIPNIETLVIIAKYFNVSTDYLVGLED